MNGRSLKTRFCEQFGCPASAFEELAFKNCLYPHAKYLAPALRLIKPDFFAADFNFVGDLGKATDWADVKSEMLCFQDSNRAGGFTRKILRLRVSGRKAKLLAGKLLEQELERNRLRGNALPPPPTAP